jgi:hypothetical protein
MSFAPFYDPATGRHESARGDVPAMPDDAMPSTDRMEIPPVSTDAA